MKKKLFMVMMTAVMVFSGSMTAFAAPEIMPDGTVFDAEYYAQQNPDVAAVFGTNRDALYHHYASLGKNEGRAAYDVEALNLDVNVSDQSQDTVPKTTVKKLVKKKTSYYSDNSLDGYTVYTYDSQGNMIRETSYSNEHRSSIDNVYEYDSQGNKIKENCADSSYTLYSYDDNDNMIREKLYGRDGQLHWEWVYSYDSQGNRIEEVVYWNGSYYTRTVYTYDSQGKLTEELNYTTSRKLSSRYIYSYDAQGNLIRKDRYDEPDGNMPESHLYSYDGQGNLTEEQFIWCGGLLEHYTYSYGAQGNLARKDEYHYQNLNGPGGKLLEQRIYYYDDNGDIIREEWYDNIVADMFMCLYFIYEY